jgi:hypothetical protein
MKEQRVHGQQEYRDPELRFYQPDWEETNIVFVDEPTLLEAQAYICGCEHCSDDTEITFDYVLDAVTKCDPRWTEYLLYHPAQCVSCGSEIREKTFVAVACEL